MKRVSAHLIYTQHMPPITRGVIGFGADACVQEIINMGNRYVEMSSTIFYNGIIVPMFCSWHEAGHSPYNQQAFAQPHALGSLAPYEVSNSGLTCFNKIRNGVGEFLLLNAHTLSLPGLIADASQFRSFSHFIDACTTNGALLTSEFEGGKIEVQKTKTVLLIENFDFSNQCLTSQSKFRIMSASTL